LQRVSDLLEAHFPITSRLHTPSLEMHHAFLVPSIGNNDVEPDYNLSLRSNSTLLRAAANAWASELTEAERADVLQGGYLAREVTPGFIIASINTVIYSPKHTPVAPEPGPDPLGQFAWLNQTLASARASNKTVAVVGHIPPSLASYDDSPPQHDFASFWKPEYIDTIYRLLAEHADVVPAMLFGHLHSDEFRVDVSLGHDAPPLLISGSVTPAFGNNPSFRVMTYDNETGEILDYDVYVLDVASGATEFVPLYRFSEAYKYNNISLKPNREGLTRVACELESNPDAVARFARYNKADAPGAYNYSGQTWACLMTQVEVELFHQCDRGVPGGACPTPVAPANSTAQTTSFPFTHMSSSTTDNSTVPSNSTSSSSTTASTSVMSTSTSSISTADNSTSSSPSTSSSADTTGPETPSGDATTSGGGASGSTTHAQTTSTTAAAPATTGKKPSPAGGSGSDKQHTQRLSALGAGIGVIVALVVVGVVLVARVVSRRHHSESLYAPLNDGDVHGDDNVL
jgi:hypothetical protein